MAAAALTAASLSTLSLWWALPAAVAAFLCGRWPGRTAPTALALLGLLAAGVVVLYAVPAWLPLAGRFVGVLVAALMVPWFAGRFWCQYQQLVRAGWERADQLQRERELVAEQARLRERTRIAQDMHDVLGHDLSLIALSAGALKLAPGLAESHRKAAGDIRARAAGAVERLGEVIGVLREESAAPSAYPRDAGVADLVARARAAGLAVELRTDGEAEGMAPVVERALHRVVQESLTNVAKHARGATATVEVAHADTESRVVVRNTPPPAGAVTDVRPASRGGGHGLIGLEERVRLTGGSVDHGPRADGGFEVAATLPHIPPPRPPSAPDPRAASGLPPEHRRARGRAGRTLAAAVLVPLLTGAVLTGGLMAWQVVSASRSVLEPGDYARLRLGQDRSEVARFLPSRQTDYRPLTAEPTGDGLTCEYYAMTADRFDDRSGDAYRLCFRDGVLVSLGTLTP
ncbi:histidine kinase [Streptomyces sp. NPDC001941]|uniref:sensor histidine kinase n=1 Tax=Streptomyces sp. NPDC001941 TaxID=3154659 RepID=UPI00331ECAE6